MRSSHPEAKFRTFGASDDTEELASHEHANGAGLPPTGRHFLGNSHHLLNPWVEFRNRYSILSVAGRAAELPFEAPVFGTPFWRFG